MFAHPNMVQMTRAELDAMLEEAEKRATNRAFCACIALPLLSIRDEFGFGMLRLGRVAMRTCERYGKVDAGEIDLADEIATLFEETCIRVSMHDGNVAVDADALPDRIADAIGIDKSNAVKRHEDGRKHGR